MNIGVIQASTSGKTKSEVLEIIKKHKLTGDDAQRVKSHWVTVQMRGKQK